MDWKAKDLCMREHSCENYNLIIGHRALANEGFMPNLAAVR